MFRVDPDTHRHDPEERTIFHLIFSVPCLLVILRWLGPLSLPLWGKGALAIVLLIASQYHLWSRLSSGSVFAAEFPRPIVIAFNWAFGAIIFLALLQILLDFGMLGMSALRRDWIIVPDGVRYGAAGLAALLSAIGVSNALRVPPLNDVEIGIRGLPS
jgi:hypothetical protein